MRGRAPATLVATAGALLATLGSQAASSPLIGPALAVLAGLALSLMLYRTALRVLGVAVTALSVAGLGWAVSLGAWLVAAGFAVSAAGLLGVVVWGPRWVRRSPAAERRLDDWSAMDAGLDPTTTGDEQRPDRAA